MKVKRVKIGVRPPGTIFDEATDVLQQLESGQKVRSQREWLYFSDVREMGSGASRKIAPRVEYETLTVEVHL